MKMRLFGRTPGVPVLAACLLTGCGDGTDVKLADVPPTTPATSESAKPAPNSRVPKNAKFSPSVLPGQGPK